MRDRIGRVTREDFSVRKIHEVLFACLREKLAQTENQVPVRFPLNKDIESFERQEIPTLE